MTCRDAIDYLLDYLSGELPATERALFESHLAECPECVTYLKTYQEGVRLGKAVMLGPDTACQEMPEELVQAILKARAASGS